VRENPNVMNLANFPNLKEVVTSLLDQLERCTKALNDFLEEKRSKFPRFYFIGDDDLLEILGQSQNPAVIQNHLKKLFAGIHTVQFSDDKKNIVAMKSNVGEVVPLTYAVRVTEKVRITLINLINLNILITLITLNQPNHPSHPTRSKTGSKTCPSA
jgi:dynein heavy chain 2